AELTAPTRERVGAIAPTCSGVSNGRRRIAARDHPELVTESGLERMLAPEAPVSRLRSCISDGASRFSTRFDLEIAAKSGIVPSPVAFPGMRRVAAAPSAANRHWPRACTSRGP